MRHFLPKCSSSTATSNPQDGADSAASKSCAASCSKSRCSRTTPQKVLCLLVPRSVPGAAGRVFVLCCEHWVLSYSAHTANHCYSKKNKDKHFQKENTFPLPLIMSLRPALGGLPLKTIQPLATRAKAWQAIPGVSDWVIGIIKRGYAHQFARRPPRFGSVVSTSVQRSTSHVPRAEVMCSTAQSKSDFCRRYFLIPKKDGGLRPILDPRHLNRALLKRPFRMITLK